MRYGSRARNDEIEFVYKKTSTVPRFAIVVSTKVDTRATKRNRIRRIVSESLRHLLPLVVPVDGVFLVRQNIADLTQAETQALVSYLFTQARLLNTEL